jgi:LacI family transcriptional regulator
MNSKDNKAHAVTISDVARAAGVSMATVSRVLNGYEHVTPAKRQRVTDAMERLGYTVNLQARSLAGGRLGIIGMLVHDLSNPYAAQIVQGIDTALQQVEYELALYTTHLRSSKEVGFANMLAQGSVDGLLVSLPLIPEAYLRKLSERGFPYVVITDLKDFDDFSPSIGITNWQGAYDGTSYLLGLGHRRIGLVGGPTAMRSASERLDAYQTALADENVPFDPMLVQRGDYIPERGYEAASLLLDLPDPPTAIFATNDFSAQGVYNAVMARGLRIPDDVSILGFDDIPLASYLHPPLTTVRQPMLELSRTAIEMVIRQIENPGIPADKLILPTELVVRDSCAPPRQA